MECLPPPAVDAVPLTMPASTAWTLAPEIPVPPVTLVIAPDTPPATSTVNAASGLAWFDTFTTRGPVDAPAGTGALMTVSLHCVGLAGVPVYLIAFVPPVAPNRWPMMVTGAPTCPPGGGQQL